MRPRHDAPPVRLCAAGTLDPTIDVRSDDLSVIASPAPRALFQTDTDRGPGRSRPATADANATNETFQLIYDNNPANLLPTLAAFLLIRGPHGLFQYTVIGPYECASAPCGRPDSPASGFGPYHWSPLLELDYGTPVGPAVQGRDGVWRRQWTKADVSLNCSEWVGRVELHN